MAEEYLDRIRAFGTDDYYGQTVNLAAGDIPQVLGKPTYESTTMDGLLSTTTNYHTVYGDFRNYVIADRVGLAVEFVPNLFHTGANRPSASRGWLAHWRVGADSINDTGFVLGINQNTAAASV
jgi:HK97 family phage major capsid protein